ncbi:MAG: alpha/beta hydrolase [Acetobacteraceae bacterium]|nr:alpha/beta hydrolase [Acetobacteraceae bacterium]
MASARSLPLQRRLLLLLAPGAALVASACSMASGGEAPASQSGIGIERDVPYAAGPRQLLDIYRPEAGEGGLPLILFFHGGQWQMGSKDSLENHVIAMDLAERGAVVLAANYRLYPETRFPGFLEDAAAAVVWARRHAARLGADPDAIFVAGHSAGGYMALMLALDGQWLAREGMDHRDLAGAIGIAGPYAGNFPRHWAVSPVFAGQPDLAPLLPESFAAADAPPLLLLGGGMDGIVGASQVRIMEERVVRAGGRVESRVYPGIGHLGILMSLPWLPSLAPTAADIMRFVTRQHVRRMAAWAPLPPDMWQAAAP